MTNHLRMIGLAVALAVTPLGVPVAATETAETGPITTGALPETAEARVAERKRAREEELQAIRRTIEVSQKRQAALRDDIAGIESDRARLSGELVATMQRLREAEIEIGRIETRLDRLHANEDGIRRSLRTRRAVLAEVLVALQRMGRTPPPAILSRPEDALAAIRGSILAGAVLPDLRVEAEALAADLAELSGLATRIETARDALRGRYAALGDEQARIDLLMEAKKTQRDRTEQALTAEAAKSGDLAAKAQSLAGLIDSLENEVAAAAEAAEEARKAAASIAPADKLEAARRLADTSRIAPAVRFADAKGLLTLPVPGDRLMGFGEPDGLGGTAQGLSLAARPGTPVVAPTDGWVVYAGPFRSYGQVLIINAGDGYHIVMAGMERNDAAVGQFVLAGEPVAAMGATRLASLGDVEHTSAQPTLYVEFRKDGTAIDSTPWWARQDTDEGEG